MTYPFEFSEQALEDLADLWTFFDQKFGTRTTDVGQARVAL
jgi:hypothetical protein